MEELEEKNNYLLNEVARGNERSFEELFKLYKDRVYSIALVYTENNADAEEIVQDVFSRIWKYRQRVNEIKNFSAWIVTVTRHRSLTALKKIAVENTKKKMLSQLTNDKSELNAEGDMQEKELKTLLKNALARLTPQQRKIFELSRLQGQDRKLIAKTLGLSPATVSVHLTIALRTVRSFLYEHQYETLILCFILSIF